MDNYEYETPSEFEDEEIDEDLAFTAEDEHKLGDMFGGSKAAADEDDVEDDELDEDPGGAMPESDDDEKNEAGSSVRNALDFFNFFAAFKSTSHAFL